MDPAPEAPPEAWHYAVGRQQLGPVTRAELTQLARSGAISADTLVWRHGMPDWARIGLLPELADLGAAPPTLPGELHNPQAKDSDPGVRMLIPIGRSPWAIVAGYLGLFSLLGIFAPFAIITGIVAIYDIRKHPTRHGMGRAIFGILMGVVCALAYLWMMMR